MVYGQAALKVEARSGGIGIRWEGCKSPLSPNRRGRPVSRGRDGIVGSNPTSDETALSRSNARPCPPNGPYGVTPVPTAGDLVGVSSRRSCEETA